MTTKYYTSHIGIHVVALIAFLLSSCASMNSMNSMNSSKEELRNLGANEGVVVGSVLITVEGGDTNESGLASHFARKADELEYSVSISETGSNPPKVTYTLPATPGKEAFFVKILPAGNYKMVNIRPTGALTPTLALTPTALVFPLGPSFNIKPQKVSYIGKLVVTLPNRIMMGSPYQFTVQDAQQETIDKLKNDYPSIMANAVKELAKRDEGPNLVPGNTIASPLLQRNTLTLMYALDSADDTTCAKRTIVNAEMVKKATAADVTVQERWTLDRCGKTVPYLVIFTPSPQGGTDFNVMKER